MTEFREVKCNICKEIIGYVKKGTGKFPQPSMFCKNRPHLKKSKFVKKGVSG